MLEELKVSLLGLHREYSIPKKLKVSYSQHSALKPTPPNYNLKIPGPYKYVMAFLYMLGHYFTCFLGCLRR